MKGRHQPIARIVFRMKRWILQGKRGIQNLTCPTPRFLTGDALPFIIGEVRSPLRPDENPKEYLLTLGKIENLRIALTKIHLIVIPAGEVFSFWKVIGRLSASNGYVVGREIREGCIIPTIGGGICQLTNSLYQLALFTGCEIVERHSHSMVLPGSESAKGADATVAWNDIDLRFSPPVQIQIECSMSNSELIVRFRSAEPFDSGSKIKSKHHLTVLNAGCCVTCGQSDCSRHSPKLEAKGDLRPTYVFDAAWPEWKHLVADRPGKLLVSRSTGNSGRFAWGDVDGQAPIAALKRSLQARLDRNAPPPIVRRHQMDADVQIASALSKKLTFQDDDLVIAISLLAGLWTSGQLAGRRFTVVMNRPPLSLLHRLLDDARSLETDSVHLSDFRADQAIVAAEDHALENCHRIITCHVGFAGLMRSPVELRPWAEPQVVQVERVPKRLIVFPGPATARNGSRSVREAARILNLKVALLGSMLESRDLWDGVELVEPMDWEAKCLAVVQPSVFEARPSVLLRARALDIPILASPMCGLMEGEYQSVNFGDCVSLVKILAELICDSGLEPEVVGRSNAPY